MRDQPVEILLVEDDEDDYVLARDLLSEIGQDRFKLEWVRSVDEAIACLDRCNHGVFLVDYRLGAQSGIDFLTEATRRRCEAPVILLTGEGGHEEDVRAMEAGAADFLSKGEITAPILERSIRYALQQKHNERQRIEMIRAQADLREAEADKRAAEAANAAKDQFLATVSHELRTPLNAILGWTELLKQEVHSADAAAMDVGTLREAVETIERNARGQQQLIEDLLDVSRIIAGKVRIDPRACRLQDVLESAVASVALTARRRSIRLETDWGGVVPPVIGDPDRLQQVFWNLLSNAVKFTPEGGGVHVSLRRMSAHAQVTIRDTGQGIGADDLPRVFDRFHQAGRSGRAGRPGEHDGNPEGLGLGLAIVHHLVDLHGGSVTAHSEGEGMGSTFTVTLPLSPAAGEVA